MSDPRDPSRASAPVLSIVIPVFNEQENLRELHKRLQASFADLGIPYEVVLVDDGSGDQSRAIMRQLHSEDPRYCWLALSRNFGHQTAITAGMDHARGDAVVIMDADLQDPPELVGNMVARWSAGADVVYGVREDRLGISRLRQAIYRSFYRLLRRLTPIEIPIDSGDFRLLSRRVIEDLKRMPERNRYVRGLVAWVGYRQEGLPYSRPGRHLGTAKYTWSKLMRLALDGIFSFSYIPLKAATWLGFLVTGLGFLYGSYALIAPLFGKTTPQGWTSLVIVVLVLGGAQLITLGIIGAYIGRIFDEVKQRPLYLVAEKQGV